FAVTDGERVVLLPPAQDHKRLLDGDRGPNTGGMGAYAPVSLASPEEIDAIVERIIRPTLAALRERQTPFSGLLYAGLMITPNGPKVVEFNCRFGDPETQAVLPALAPTASLLEMITAVARGGRLDESLGAAASQCAVTTVVAAAGYPEQPRVGDAMTLPDA